MYGCGTLRPNRYPVITTSLAHYIPARDMSIDEAMVKYKG